MLRNIIKDASLADSGKERTEWYRNQMKIMNSFKNRYLKERLFENMKLLVCMHCEPKAAIRTEVLLAKGNPIEIMELGYALQLLSLEEIVKNKTLNRGIQNLTEHINQETAKMLLDI